MSEDVQSIIDRILASPRAQANRAFAGRTFTDEPIIRRGSQMATYLPEQIREMRRIATSPESRTKPEALVFLRQAQFMEDYTDDVVYHGTFEHYFPTYQAMSDRQLRGYFTWRAAVRRGDIWRTSLSFVFVHLYELLCGVGATPGAEGFRVIERFWWAYREYEPRIDRYVRTWLRDYAVWHNLDRALIEPYVNLEFDRALIAMRNGLAGWNGGEARPLATPLNLIAPDPSPTRTASPRTGKRGRKASNGADNPVEEELFSSLDALSSYRPRVSRLYQTRPETLRHVCCATLVRLSLHYDRHRKAGLMESLFGSPLAMPHEMFASAVFWPNEPHPDAVYELDEVNRYTCARGRWYWEGYHGSHDRNAKLGAVLRAVDQRLRDAIGYPHPLAEKQVPKYLTKIIDDEIAARLAWEREREALTIHVDLSQLAGIRAAASTTREALLVDEEREDEAPAPLAQGQAAEPDTHTETMANEPGPTSAQAGRPGGAAVSEDLGTLAAPAISPGSAAAPGGAVSVSATTAPAIVASVCPQAETGSPMSLTAPELALVEALLEGTPYTPPAGTSLDMLVDGINEKLFELLGDTALEFDLSRKPTIIEDYLEDVRGAIHG